MVATDFEIKFAQSRVDYFEKVLKKGEGDGLKTLLRAIKAEGSADYTASGIANAIKASKVILQTAKDAAVTKAAQLTKAAAAMKVVPGVTQADIDTAVQNAKAAAVIATTKAAAMKEVTAQNIADAKAAAVIATTKAAAMKVVPGVTQADIDTAVQNAKDATTKAAAMKVVPGVTQDDINKAIAAALDATTKANAIKVGDDPVLTAAKALLGDDTVTKIKAEIDTTKLTTLYTDKAPDFMKNYGFINAILKNIPNAGKDVLKSDAANKIFIIEAAITTQVKLDMFNAYAKIVLTACGADPFVNSNDLPEKDSHSTHVADCLEQANKIAYALLADANCGKDKLDNGSVKADCLKALAGMASDLYNGGDFDDMNIDLSGKYPYEDAIPELTKIDL